MASIFRSKKEIVYEYLREEIVQGKYEPRSRLKIDEVSKQLSVSQIPVREAIQQLEADGFVTVEPNVGATIADIDATFIYEVFALLESMEIICSRTACATMTNADLKTLSKMVSDMDKTINKPNKWFEQNKALHLFICECANTNLVLIMMQKTFDHWDRLRHHYLQDMPSNRIADAQAEHKQLLAAFLKRDPDTVEQIIRDHNQAALQSYIFHLEAEGYLLTTES